MRTITLLILATALVGCGGGGSDASSGSTGSTGSGGNSSGSSGSGGSSAPAGSGSTGSNQYPVTVSVTGLGSGASVTLSDNGSDALTVTNNGTFTFAAALASGASYAVSVTAQPSSALCTVSSGSGTASAASLTVAVSCIGPFQIGGSISGLTSGVQLDLLDNLSDTLTLGVDGSFNFATGVKPGGSYSVTLGTLPTGEQCVIQNASGTVSNGNIINVAVTCEAPTLRLVAGALGGTGNADGLGSAARFANPINVALDASGNLYVADIYNATLRKINTAGMVTSLAGKAGQPGTSDGVGSAARFNDPFGLAVDQSGTVYVSDAGANTIRRVTADGTVTTLAGTPYTSGTSDGTGSAAQFTNVGGIQISPSGSLYLVDQARIRNITTAGLVSTLFSGTSQLSEIALASSSVLLATDLGVGIGRNTVDKIDLSAATDTALAGGFENPAGIVLAPSGTSAAGTIYVSDQFNGTLNAIGPSNAVTVLAGVANQIGSTDGTGSAALFWDPAGMAIDSNGNIFLADSGNNEIRKITAAGVVTTIAGAAAQIGETDATGAAARFDGPGGILVDSSGNLFVGELSGIRKVTPTGAVTHALPSGLPSPLTVGQEFAVDSGGNFYFTTNDTIAKISPSGTVTTVAGMSNLGGYLDAVGTQAFFSSPSGVAFDSSGNLYVADTRNYLIRKIAPDATVTTVAGQPGVAGQLDGSGTSAQFTSPISITIDSTGTLYVADGNAIRKITTSGLVTTLAGSQTAGSADGTGPAAQMNGPTAMAIGLGGSLYVADTLNHEIRKVSAAGAVTTIAGSAGQAGVALGALPAGLNSPTGLAYFGTTLYVTDGAENSVLEITDVP